ncbi:MAG: DUF6876 family protein [Cyanobacteria bacterium P01_A01_bin.40]
MTTNTKEVNKERLEAELLQFRGSMTPRIRYSYLFPHLYLTEGAKHLAEHGRLYWLMDVIGSYQSDPRVKHDKMLKRLQFWRLKKNEDDSGIVYCERDLNNIVLSQKLTFTDSILDSVLLYVAPFHLSPDDSNPENKKLVLLPSEN